MPNQEALTNCRIYPKPTNHGKEVATMLRLKKNMVYFALAIFILFCLTGASVSKATAAQSVKVGVILPLSGPVAPIGKTAQAGLDYAAKEINEAGGIKALDGAKIELIYADSTGKPEVGLSEAERLILKENAAVLMGAYQSSVTYTSSEAAQRYQTPYMVIISVMDKITERGLKYVFRPTQTASDQSAAMVNFLKDAGERKGKKVKTVALVYENTDWGQASSQVWKKYCEQYGFQVVLDESYPNGSTDLTPVVIKLKRFKPDAVLNVSYISDMILLVKTAADMKFECMAWVSGGGGELDPKFIPAVGDLANYYFTVTPWQFDVVLSRPWIKAANDGFKAMTGTDFTTVSAMTYSNMYTLQAVLEKAGSRDKEKIRQAFADIVIDSGKAMILPFEKIDFDETGQNPYQRMTVSQFLDKQIRVISPAEFTAPGIELVWPMPPWSKR
jgi:branched-chain amino acid transport system substrate-binding protein